MTVAAVIIVAVSVALMAAVVLGVFVWAEGKTARRIAHCRDDSESAAGPDSAAS